MRRRSPRASVTAAAAGIVASPSRASTTDQPAARFRGRGPLLLDVRATNSRWWDRAADYAGHRDQGQEVRQSRDQVRRDVRLALERDRERKPEAEEQRRHERPARPPLPEDDRRQRDVAAAAGHVLG